mmetsp:Transcript_8139/g.9707  ORF Transcript_8139/g.9707 Transcript_8139/m.9707 type:complete len:107 (+) Transcript_8139:459-779(+)
MLPNNSNKTISNALYIVYFSHEDWFGSWLDLSYIFCGIFQCIEWILFVQNLKVVEKHLQGLHRPSGVVAYDDNDADVWSDYHHEIADIELEVGRAIENMVFKVSCF